MDWASVVDQLEKFDRNEVHRCIPLSGEALASRVQVQIAGGLVALNKLIKQATVRRHIVVQLVRMWRDAGHPDYQRVFNNPRAFYERLRALSPENEAAREESACGTCSAQRAHKLAPVCRCCSAVLAP